jgi:hypothetical protein
LQDDHQPADRKAGGPDDMPTFLTAYRYLAACYAHLGLLDAARDTIVRLRAITPEVMVNYPSPFATPAIVSCISRAGGWQPATPGERPIPLLLCCLPRPAVPPQRYSRATQLHRSAHKKMRVAASPKALRPAWRMPHHPIMLRVSAVAPPAGVFIRRRLVGMITKIV